MFNKKTNEIHELKKEISRLEKLNKELTSKLNEAEIRAENYKINYFYMNRSNRAWELAVQRLAVEKLGCKPGKEANTEIWYPACAFHQQELECLKTELEKNRDL